MLLLSDFGESCALCIRSGFVVKEMRVSILLLCSLSGFVMRSFGSREQSLLAPALYTLAILLYSCS